MKPKSKGEQTSSWNAKNQVNGRKLEVLVDASGQAIYANANYLGAVHDKRIFDESEIINFISEHGSSGISNIRAVIADKGYQGIKNIFPNSVHMMNGKDPAIIEFNNGIAQDSQIVERWNCRVKMCWGMMHEVYRSDLSKHVTIL